MFTRSRLSIHIWSYINRASSLILPVAACILLTTVALYPGRTVEAQAEVTSSLPQDVDDNTLAVSVSGSEPTSDRWPGQFGEQIAEVLRERGPKAKQAVMLDVISTTSMGEGRIDLGPALSPLLQIAQSDSNQNHREMAVRAIAAIGPEYSSERRYRRVVDELRSTLLAESSERVRRLRKMVVRDFYARKEEETRPPMPKVPEHEVETRLIEVEGDLEQSIEEDPEHLEEAALPPMPKVPVHEAETHLIEVEGDLEKAIEQDLQRLEEDAIPPMPKVPVHEVQNRLIETEGNLDQSIEEDLKRLEETRIDPLPPYFSPDSSIRSLHKRDRF